jgi:hypothetical protein
MRKDGITRTEAAHLNAKQKYTDEANEKAEVLELKLVPQLKY